MENNSQDNQTQLKQEQTLTHQRSQRPQNYLHIMKNYQTLDISKPIKKHKPIKIKELPSERFSQIRSQKNLPSYQMLNKESSSLLLPFDQQRTRQQQLINSDSSKYLSKDVFQKPDYLMKKNFQVYQPWVPLADKYKLSEEDSNQQLQTQKSRVNNELTMLKNEQRIKTIVDGLNLNTVSKRKVAFSMRNSLDNSTKLLQQQSQYSTDRDMKLPKIKHKELENQIKEMKLRKIDKFTKAYLQDYTVFNYKIDKVLNEAYGFIKNHNR